MAIHCVLKMSFTFWANCMWCDKADQAAGIHTSNIFVRSNWLLVEFVRSLSKDGLWEMIIDKYDVVFYMCFTPPYELWAITAVNAVVVTKRLPCLSSLGVVLIIINYTLIPAILKAMFKLQQQILVVQSSVPKWAVGQITIDISLRSFTLIRWET